MTQKVISMEYTLVDANTKEQLDSNVGQPALEFISGMGQLIPGLEEAVSKMEAGETADILVEPKDAYGEYNEEMIQTLPKEQFADIELEKGMKLYGSDEQGNTIQVIVKDIQDDTVTIDYNHELAGKSLLFTVAILDTRDATDEELQTGVVGGMDNDSCGCGCGDHSCN